MPHPLRCGSQRGLAGSDLGASPLGSAASSSLVPLRQRRGRAVPQAEARVHPSLSRTLQLALTGSSTPSSPHKERFASRASAASLALRSTFSGGDALRLSMAFRSQGADSLDSTGFSGAQGTPQLELMDSCCICLEAIYPRQDVYVFPCRHRLHAFCARKWLRVASQPSCPTCRQQVPLARGAGAPQGESAPSTFGGRAPSRPVEPEWVPQGMLDLPDPWDDSVPTGAVANVMATCQCTRRLAEAALHEATSRETAAFDAEASMVAAPGGAAKLAVELVLERQRTRGAALQRALLEEHYQVARELLGLGDCDLGAPSRRWAQAGGSEQTALMLATRKRHYHLAKAMCEALAAGTAGTTANIDARDSSGRTALALALAAGYPEMEALLLAYGASEAEARRQGQRPRDLSRTTTTAFWRGGVAS